MGQSSPSERLDQIRRDYAERVSSRTRPPDPRVVAAFATVPRERFLGPGPWLIRSADGYIRTPDADPARIYRDVLVALEPLQRLNNGQPSLHAAAIARLGLRRGETVLHIGAGTGYYTAILAELVGPAGHVHAYEIEPRLAALARANLAERENVVLHDETEQPVLPPADAIYVNAGAGGPQRRWLDALTSAGRLIFPLTGDDGTGVMLLLMRTPDPQVFGARCLGPVQFIPLVGGHDDIASPHIAAAWTDGRLARARSLVAGKPLEPATCLLEGDGWWLSTDEISSPAASPE
ncbi:protein-L-isoaspartate O-methyltransferase family protein [Chelatococcus asaccharovorans]|uniref:protein-L-isoaspartate O-methyltransferase family protein n=1 Tax=Chelatococcus asaccharovorans TaxID=28210 RepID=UPI00224C6A02|nr:rRNA adenine N-6-methyltransferase family protein [Chelatococcus asaccharovorans]CAH1666884.1 L-isoaspartyl protein carboxyl methyltransferase [Chelatococcus asaccharovorans]CAH1681276.1 L-isoaspartyl protein carboxyl methyltransferase [Chelatococcus asaccharovorans]